MYNYGDLMINDHVTFNINEKDSKTYIALEKLNLYEEFDKFKDLPVERYVEELVALKFLKVADAESVTAKHFNLSHLPAFEQIVKYSEVLGEELLHLADFDHALIASNTNKVITFGDSESYTVWDMLDLVLEEFRIKKLPADKFLQTFRDIELVLQEEHLIESLESKIKDVPYILIERRFDTGKKPISLTTYGLYRVFGREFSLVSMPEHVEYVRIIFKNIINKFMATTGEIPNKGILEWPNLDMAIEYSFTDQPANKEINCAVAIPETVDLYLLSIDAVDNKA